MITEKINDSSSFFSPFDKHSKVIIAKHHGRVIASCRLFFPETDKTQIEHQQYDISFPKDFPTNSSIVEMMRLCTCLLYTSPSPRDATLSRMPSSA